METDSHRAGKDAEAFKPHNKKQLAILLGVSLFILNKWIDAIQEELGDPIGTVYSAKQVQMIVRKYGDMGRAA
jgi:hypothetical protein